MGTRASFWTGNPTDTDNRILVGCIAWDGYLEGIPEEILTADTEEEYIEHLVTFREERDDFADPDNGWPYPWADNIFITDRTYAFFDGEVHMAHFDAGFVPVSRCLEYDRDDPDATDPFRGLDPLPETPAPSEYNPEQPDSIMVLTTQPADG